MKLTSTNICLYLGRHAHCGSGLWVYSHQMVQSLLEEQLAQGRDLESIEVVGGGSPEVCAALSELADKYPGVKFHISGFSQTGRRLSHFLDALLMPTHSRLTHGTSNLVPLRGSGCRVVTLHDLLQAYSPVAGFSAYRWVRSILYRQLFRLIAGRADMIITDHEAVRSQIIARLHPPCPVEVLYPALAGVFQETPEVGTGSGDELLCFGSTDARKNLPGVLEALRHKRLEGKFLRVICPSSEAKRRADRLARSFDLEKRVVFSERVGEQELLSLYRRAAVVLFPSFAEGFGYPIYEAMSQGVPVVVSPGAVVEQLKSETASLYRECQPESSESIALAAADLLENPPGVQERRSVSARVRQALCSRQVAREALVLYEKVLDAEAE